MNSFKVWSLRLLIAAVVGSAGYVIWKDIQSSGLDNRFASGNGRIEATEIDVATKRAGRVVELLADEGDFVTEGQVLARMETDILEAELAEAKAQLRKTENAQTTATAMVSLRESEKVTAEAVVAQREAELTASQRRLARTESLVTRSAVTEQELDDNRAAVLSGQAALAAAKSEVASSVAGINAAKSQVIEAESAIEAAQAVVRRIQSDLDDSQLKAPRNGRVQYRIAEVGEVLPAGGKVLSLIDVSDVYLTFFLPTGQAGRVEMGQEARLVLDPVPQYVIPAQVSYVSNVAQFTPKSVETAKEREKLMFRIKARIVPELLKEHMAKVKTGVPGVAYLRLDPTAEWPDNLQINVPK